MAVEHDLKESFALDLGKRQVHPQKFRGQPRRRTFNEAYDSDDYSDVSSDDEQYDHHKMAYIDHHDDYYRDSRGGYYVDHHDELGKEHYDDWSKTHR